MGGVFADWNRKWLGMNGGTLIVVATDILSGLSHNVGCQESWFDVTELHHPRFYRRHHNVRGSPRESLVSGDEVFFIE